MSLLDDARRLAEIEPFDDGGNGAFAPACVFCYEKPHEPDCHWLAMPKIVAALEAADDLAGLLLMVLDNQIRNGWVAEDSPLLEEPRKALERWHALT